MTRRNALKRIVTLASAILAAGFGRSKAEPTDTRYWVPFATPCPDGDGYAPVGRVRALDPRRTFDVVSCTVDTGNGPYEVKDWATDADDREGWVDVFAWAGCPAMPPPARVRPDGTYIPRREACGMPLWVDGYRNTADVPKLRINGRVRFVVRAKNSKFAR